MEGQLLEKPIVTVVSVVRIGERVFIEGTSKVRFSSSTVYLVDVAISSFSFIHYTTTLHCGSDERF